MEVYRCSNPVCPVSFRDLEKSVKKCSKCGSKVVKVKTKEEEE